MTLPRHEPVCRERVIQIHDAVRSRSIQPLVIQHIEDIQRHSQIDSAALGELERLANRRVHDRIEGPRPVLVAERIQPAIVRHLLLHAVIQNDINVVGVVIARRRARSPTTDQQPLPMQHRAMREYVVRRGWTIAIQVREVGSGAAKREARERLIEAARRRDIDVVLVWRLDRWGRSVTDLLATLQELEHLGVGFVSLTEALDLTTPAGRAMAVLLAVFAEFEKEILSERTRAGLAHARQNGKRLGRPITAGLQAAAIRKLHRAGVAKAEIARRLQIGRTAVRRVLS